MGLADLIPTAEGWTIVSSSELVPFSRDMDKATKAVLLGRALVAHGPGGTEVPVLRLAFADRSTKGGLALDSLRVMAGDSSAGEVSIGFGAARHAILVPAGGGWRVAGVLVRHGRKLVTGEVDHRYAVVVDGVQVGEFGGRGGELYWAPPTGPALVASMRPSRTEPVRLKRNGWRGVPGAFAEYWRATAPASRPDRNAQPRWLEQTVDVIGTADVRDASGQALVTLCPPGAAHSTRFAVLPQPGVMAPSEAVLLAAYMVFAM